MLYNTYELQRGWWTGAGAMASVMAEWMHNPTSPAGMSGLGNVMASALDVFAHAAQPRGKPVFGIGQIEVDGQTHTASERIVLRRPFGNLLRFAHAGLAENAPPLLIVAPMSGHYATLRRGTVARMMQRHVVYVTDWADAKMVPLAEGAFDLNDYIDYLVGFLELVGREAPGGRAHVLAVCQPSVPALAATALMANHPHRPASLTMMGGPIDTRCAPTSVDQVAEAHSLDWFKTNLTDAVPLHYPGAGRKVYPGFLQLAGFFSMNMGAHMRSHYELFRKLVEGDEEGAVATKRFYEEFRSVCDLTAEFYLQTVEQVFQHHALPRGEFHHRGRQVDVAAIRDTALLAIEGERDDISGIGQTRAALDLAGGLPDTHKRYLLAEGVGHYGIFNGSAWRRRIAPVVEQWIAAHSPA